ncbi:MAG: PHP domain-containing protein [Candidatus Cloacimonetes bacterium]|nr:PHP domain-containing protein [Candidatus Cloacimonadota bacterium]
MKLDLHTHSTASDGTLTPQELVREAHRLKLEYLSLTDHDTIDGLSLISDIPEGLHFINGVEISAEFPKTLHILGYGFDRNNEGLHQTLKELQDFRLNRNKKMIENMKALGFDITLDELEKEAGGVLIGRPHFANLFARKGYVSSYQEAFDKYLDKGKPLYLNKKRLHPKKAINLILDAGGIPVIAHPYQTKLDDQHLENLVAELNSYGLMGIEVYYSQHTPEQVTFYTHLAIKYGLLTTAGSDYHGSTKPNIHLGMIVDRKCIEPFLQKLRK